MDIGKKYEEKYKEVALEDASSYYYGDGNAMDQALAEMQDGINKAAAEYANIRGRYDDPHVNINICQDRYEITFHIATYDDDEFEYVAAELFYRHPVGEAMAEALVLMQMMEDSGTSTGVSQTVNNWVEDLNFSGFGEFDLEYSISDSWDLIDY